MISVNLVGLQRYEPDCHAWLQPVKATGGLQMARLRRGQPVLVHFSCKAAATVELAAMPPELPSAGERPRRATLVHRVFAPALRYFPKTSTYLNPQNLPSDWPEPTALKITPATHTPIGMRAGVRLRVINSCPQHRGCRRRKRPGAIHAAPPSAQHSERMPGDLSPPAKR